MLLETTKKKCTCESAVWFVSGSMTGMRYQTSQQSTSTSTVLVVNTAHTTVRGAIETRGVCSGEQCSGTYTPVPRLCTSLILYLARRRTWILQFSFSWESKSERVREFVCSPLTPSTSVQQPHQLSTLCGKISRQVVTVSVTVVDAECRLPSSSTE